MVLTALYALDDRIDARVGKLQKRVDELETQQKHFGYFGVWKVGNVHNRGNQVTDHGAQWACLRDGVTTRPGTSGYDWQMCEKSHR